ncbi:MAG TPA: alpha/beta hydrolase [Acidimicrobiales bacterium]|nr:alpha/beta hydrolase [Acidimicrobiales bacterium]
MNIVWRPDILGDGFEAATLALRPRSDGEEPTASLVRHLSGPERTRRAVLYVHGYNDYFFQRELGAWFAGHGMDFYALDLRRYGRSLLPGQEPNYTADLREYDEELDAAVDVLIGAGHRRLLLAAHSTGGLIVPLWAARRPGLGVDGLILNSPFLEFKQPAAVRMVAGRAATVIARRQPLRALPAGVSTGYGDSLHASRRGQWDYDLRLKPSPGFPPRFGWVNAIVEGHRDLHRGLDQRAPTLVLCSTRTVTAEGWEDDLTRGDAVLDADRIARWAPALGRHVTTVRIEDALHDVFLSAEPVREAAYDTMATWLRAWVS